MREETVQYGNHEAPVFWWARWAGIAMLSYAGAMYLESMGGPGPVSGFWNTLAIVLPYVAFAAVLLFVAPEQAFDSAAPRWVAAGLVLATVALAVRALDAPVGLPRLEAGFWGMANTLLNVALPLSLLLLLLTSRAGRFGAIMPTVATAAGASIVALGVAVSVRGVIVDDMRDLWQIVEAVTPADAFAFVLIVAGLRIAGASWARHAAVVFAVLITVATLAGAIWDYQDLGQHFPGFGWLTASNFATRAASVLLILAFGGLFQRRAIYVAAAACLLAVVVTTVGMAGVLSPEGSGLFWMVSLPTVGVAFLLLLALVYVESSYSNRDEFATANRT